MPGGQKEAACFRGADFTKAGGLSGLETPPGLALVQNLCTE